MTFLKKYNIHLIVSIFLLFLNFFLFFGEVFAAANLNVPSFGTGDTFQFRRASAPGLGGGSYYSSGSGSFSASYPFPPDGDWYAVLCILSPDGAGSECEVSPVNAGGGSLSVSCKNTECTGADLTVSSRKNAQVSASASIDIVVGVAIPGCTIVGANNYNTPPGANQDNGSCVFPPGPISGCTDGVATNHNPYANVDDGNCVYGNPGGGGGGEGSGGGPICGNGSLEGGEDCDGGSGCSATCNWLPSSCAALPSDPYYAHSDPWDTHNQWNNLKDYVSDNVCYWLNERPVHPSCIFMPPTAANEGAWRYRSDGTGDELGVGQNSCRRDNHLPGEIDIIGPGNPIVPDGNADDWYPESCKRRYTCASYTGPAPALPSFTFSCDGSCIIPYNTAVDLVWSVVSDATSCTATGGWAGAKALGGGTESTGNLITTRIYNLSCSNANGTTNKGVTVTVLPAGVTPKFSVNAIKNPIIGGTITSSPGGINCGADCIGSYDINTSVELFARQLSSYWKFNGWAGDCVGLGACILSSPVVTTFNVTAIFVPRPFIYEEF